VKTDEPALQPAPEILPPARVRFLVLMTLAALAIYLCFRIVKPFASVLIWASVLAVLFAPLRARLVARTGRPNLAAALTLSVAVVLVLAPLSVLTFALAAEISSLFAGAPERVDRLLENPDLKLRAGELYDQLRERFPWVARFDRAQVAASFQAAGDALLERSVKVVSTALQAVVQFVLIVFTLFFLLRDGERFEAQLRDLLPLGRKPADRLLARVAEVLRASTYGVVVVAAVQGLLGGLMFAALEVPSALLWGVVMALFGMIPMIGTGIVWLPVAAYLFSAGQGVKASILLAWGVLVVSTIDNVLRPYLVGSRTRLHELVVFFGILGGLKLFGLVGLFVGPAVFAIAAALVTLARERTGSSAPEAQPREVAA
jgi:predicted PurR-regulated permease PerM